jgi:hypothetical protein
MYSRISQYLSYIHYFKHKEGIDTLPSHLKYKIHNDYTFPLCFIPRSLTAYALTQPPKTLWKYNCVSQTYYEGRWGVNPIQNKLNGKLFSAHLNFPYLYFSLSTKWGWYFICGIRWDAVDFYFNFPTIDISYIGGFQK